MECVCDYWIFFLNPRTSLLHFCPLQRRWIILWMCSFQVLVIEMVQKNAQHVVLLKWNVPLMLENWRCNVTSSNSSSSLFSLRISRASSVLLSDPCFQLHSIQHLLGEGGDSSSSSAAVASTARPVVGSLGSSVASPIPSAAGNASSSERKHFSLHACEWNTMLFKGFSVSSCVTSDKCPRVMSLESASAEDYKF